MYHLCHVLPFLVTLTLLSVTTLWHRQAHSAQWKHNVHGVGWRNSFKMGPKEFCQSTFHTTTCHIMCRIWYTLYILGWIALVILAGYLVLKQKLTHHVPPWNYTVYIWMEGIGLVLGKESGMFLLLFVILPHQPCSLSHLLLFSLVIVACPLVVVFLHSLLFGHACLLACPLVVAFLHSL